MKKKKKIYFRSGMIFILTLFLAFLLYGVYFAVKYQDKFYPGVYIGDVSLGGKSYEETLSHFSDEARVLQDTGIRLHPLDGVVVQDILIPTSAQGLTSDKSFEYFSIGDWKKAVREAYGYGRTGFYWQQTFEKYSLLFQRKYFPVPYALYEDSVSSYIERSTDNYLKKTEPARFALDANGDVYVTPEKVGEAVDMKEVMALLHQKLSSLDASAQNVKIQNDYPVVTRTKLSHLLPLVREFNVNNKFVFQYKDKEWTLRNSTLLSWFTLNNKNILVLDREKVLDYLSLHITPTIDQPAKNSRFMMVNGEMVEIVFGRKGMVVDTVKTAENIEKAMNEFERNFTAEQISPKLLAGVSILPLSEKIPHYVAVETKIDEPKLTANTIKEYKIDELVGSSKTSFKGSTADRKTNITIGASKLNGLLIAPNEEFSTVDAIGYVNEAEGYAKEYVIKDNRSVKEFGGGLCQVATTLFRASLNAGLPITERTNHRYVVSYYGAGLDATIYGPHPDLRFVNDTGHYLLLQSQVVGDELIFEFYGQKDQRKVTIGEPVLTDEIPVPDTKHLLSYELPLGTQKCSETPKKGVTSDVTYTVEYPGGKIRKQNFRSVYQPWGKICLYGMAR